MVLTMMSAINVYATDKDDVFSDTNISPKLPPAPPPIPVPEMMMECKNHTPLRLEDMVFDQTPS